MPVRLDRKAAETEPFQAGQTVALDSSPTSQSSRAGAEIGGVLVVGRASGPDRLIVAMDSDATDTFRELVGSSYVTVRQSD